MEKIEKKPSIWQRFKKKISTKLKHQIEDRPPDVIVKFVHKLIFKNLNDKTLIIHSLKQSNGYGIVFMALFFFIFYLILGTLKEMFIFPGIIITLICLTLIIFGLVLQFTTPKKEIILDRENGLFTFPGFVWHKGYTIPFKDAVVGWVGIGGISGALKMELVVDQPDRKLQGTNLYAHTDKYFEVWSFYVWYMDKNRPLPPGDAFDPYREKDFLRRKSEGFPPPIYKSYIPTPEATPEQQEEREQYWTDEQNTEKFEREEGSEWYDPKKHLDWQEAIFYEPETDIPVANKYVKFIFKDGRIVYAQTNEEGSLFEPPESEYFEMVFVTVKK